METGERWKKVADVASESPRLDNTWKVTGEEPKASMSTTSTDDGKKPHLMNKRKSGSRLNNKITMAT